MHVLKKIFLFFILTLLVFSFGCTLNPGEVDDNDNTPPVISNPSDDDDKPVVTDPQDNVTFVNKTDLMVKIFSDSLKTTLLTEINYGEKFSCKADVNAVGNVFYYTYYLALDKVLVPYGTGQSIVNLSTDKSTTVNIVDPTEINTNKNIVILKNLSSSAISLGYSTSELLAENMTSTLLNQDEYGIYLLEFSNNLADYKIFDAGKNINLSETPTEEKGYIYYFDYTGKEVVLNSKTFLDKAINDKIWKISLSQEAGKTLLAGHFTTRKKSENGYMLLGRIAYNSADSSLDDTVPYYTFISPNGEILEEQTPFFRDEPRNVKIRGCVDTGKYILASGEKLSSDGIPYGFVMGIEGVNVYKDIYFADETGDENDYFSAEKIIQKTDNTFCVFVWKDKHSAPGYTEDNYISTGIGLVEVIVDSFTSVSTRILWESDEESNFNGAYYDFVYDEASDTYVVLTWNNIKDSTEVLFIDGTSGTEKNESVVLENYDFEKITKNIDGNIFLCGAFINQLTYNREACVIEIDISNGSLVDSIPKTFPAKDRNLSSYFNDIVFEDEYVIYAGSTDYKNGGDLDDTIPYMVAYDAVKDKVLWERKFDDLVGYRIYSCSDSDVSFVYELYNEKTCHSYIVSAGIMGEIPEDVKLTLPQNASIKEVDDPTKAIVYFYENFESSDKDKYYAKATFEYGDEITLDDLAEYAPADIPAGYTVTGWYKWNTDTEDEPITFPYTIEENSYFYPKLELSVYSYKLNIEDISTAWGGTEKSPMFSIIFMTDEQVEASKNYGEFNFSDKAYQIFSYGNIKIADTNRTGNYAVYGSLPVDDEYQYYTGVAATVTDTTFELLLDVSKLKKTEIKWFNSKNASGEMLTDSDTLDLTNYKPYVIALGTENADSDNYVMTIWNGDMMEMTGNPMSLPIDLEYTAPKYWDSIGFVYVEGATIIGAITAEGYTTSNFFKDGETVTVPNLYVCDHEVTQAEYEKYCSYGGSSPSSTYGIGDNYPAYCVSWYDALVYCNKRSMAENLTPCYTISGSTDPNDWGTVPTSNNSTWNAVTCNFEANGYRMPTKAEWEYAARGGNGLSDYQYKYAGSDTIDEVAWYEDNSKDKTHPVKEKEANGLGLYDMSGNVWEWCWDYGFDGHYILGGCFGNTDYNCTVSDRSYNGTYNRSNGVGFRVVRTAK